MIHSTSEPKLADLVAHQFPGVEGFTVERDEERVVPVSIPGADWEDRHEWPPIARWRVNGRRYAYVLAPTFTVEHLQASLLSRRTQAVVIDYEHEWPTLLRLLRWSIEGKSVAEMNALMGIC